MLTMLLYVLIVGLIAALLFLVASAIFGRSEELGPLPEGTTVTVLPATGISGCDVRALRFQQVFRGYKAGEVDWALTRLAARIDELEGQLARATAPETTEQAAVAPVAPTEPVSPQRIVESNGEAAMPQVLPAESTEPAVPAERGEEPGAR
ncbi:DivIVA domain-containing protein [Nocardia aurantiaca]|uniref:DivIVA domain-containing protein n=1 Tax=Nocardia aurantiaca TaxID=2675850 RepID=A0A6I3LC27_9NOCA|nr:DivIVA domain-containing protein [Nocardia aurantiaca]